MKKLTAQQKDAIKELSNSGLSDAQISVRLGIDKTDVIVERLRHGEVSIKKNS